MNAFRQGVAPPPLFPSPKRYQRRFNLASADMLASGHTVTILAVTVPRRSTAGVRE
jgi:hypothetical protein